MSENSNADPSRSQPGGNRGRGGPNRGPAGDRSRGRGDAGGRRAGDNRSGGREGGPAGRGGAGGRGGPRGRGGAGAGGPGGSGTGSNRFDSGEARPGDRGPRPSGGASERDDQTPRIPRPGTVPAADEPATPTDFDEGLLPISVRAELKGLPKELAAIVGAHILAAGQLVDEDPELAFKHAEAARRRAGRIPIVREAAAETAYAAGHYDVALREYRAIRRMNGGDQYLPVMADCERALGRPREALQLLETLDPKTKDVALRIECLLVEAGIRNDLGQRGETLRLLQAAIKRKIGPKQSQARLRYAYADLLEEDGRIPEARAWFESAERLDVDGDLDITDRIAAIDGIVLPDDLAVGVWDEPEDTEGTEATGEAWEAWEADAEGDSEGELQ